MTTNISLTITTDPTKSSARILVATHPGVFHADEVFAVAVVALLSPVEYPDRIFQVIRTRDKAAIEMADLIFDVDGVYDQLAGRFDHHQQGGAGVRLNGVPYASAGLAWLHFGKRVVRLLAPETNEVQVCEIADLVDERLVQGVDANDTGYNTGTMDVPVLSISALISALNPTWEEQSSLETQFVTAVHWAADILGRAVAEARAQVMAKAAVTAAFEAAQDGVMVLDRGGMPWGNTLHALDPDHIRVQLVVYQDLSGEYRVQSPNVAPGNFTLVCPLPEIWRAKRGDELAALTGVEDAVFVHANGFIGGAKTLAGVQEMARQAIALLHRA